MKKILAYTTMFSLIASIAPVANVSAQTTVKKKGITKEIKKTDTCGTYGCVAKKTASTK